MFWGCICLTIHASWGSLLYSWIGSLWLGGRCWLRGCRRGGSNAVRGPRALLWRNHCGSCWDGGTGGDRLHSQAYETLSYSSRFAAKQCNVPGAWSSLRPKAEMTFLLTSSWFFNGSKADMLAALTGVACFTVGSAATILPSRPSTDSGHSDREL